VLIAWRRRRAAAQTTEYCGESSEYDWQSSPLATQYGAEGAMLHVLGGQLREAISRREVDRHLLAALEWALDRHRARAVRLISLGLGDSVSLSEPLQDLVRRNGSANVGGNGSSSPLTHGERCRLLRVLKAVAPNGLSADVEALERELDEGSGEAVAEVDLHVHGPHLPR
jgi:hypothetical protein